MRIGKKLLDFLYPQNAICSGCGDLTGADEDGICSSCYEELNRMRLYTLEGCCPLCLAPITSGTCRNCELMAGWIGRASFAFSYHEPAAHIVKRFKYSSEGCMANWMARQMLQAPDADVLLRNCDILVPAPTDFIRRSRRGYNQAYLLAKEISDMTGVPAQDLLRRRPFARHQARLNRQKRLENLEGVISCPVDMKGRRVLLIDDVRTTGATAVACARALKAAGAAQVELLTFAASD